MDEVLLLQRLLAPLVVGRLVLSLLPAGWPGDHDREELGATLLASWVLGRALDPLLGWWWLLAPLLAGRLLTLPGGPRPGYRDGRSGGLAWMVLLALLVPVDLAGLAPAAAAGAALLAAAGWRRWRVRADRRGRLLAATLLPGLALLLTVSR